MISNIMAVQKRQYLFSDDRREGENKYLYRRNVCCKQMVLDLSSYKEDFVIMNQ